MKFGISPQPNQSLEVGLERLESRLQDVKSAIDQKVATKVLGSFGAKVRDLKAEVVGNKGFSSTEKLRSRESKRRS